jgi:hypothetical protein
MCQPAEDNSAPAAARAAALSRIEAIHAWLFGRLAPDGQAWLDQQLQRIRGGERAAALSVAIASAPRRLGKGALALDATERAVAEALAPGLDTEPWTVEQAARILLLLASFEGNEAEFAERLMALFRSGETGEQIAVLRGLPLFPAEPLLLPVAGEAVRSALQPVFEAVAHRNPFPARHFSEAMWNQMVVKALFIGSILATIQRLDERRNAELARMLVDYAHERWAARRPVSPELWRCVGPFASEGYFADLVKVFRTGAPAERNAAALALSECPTPEALVELETAPTLWRDIRSGRLTWSNI